MRQDGPPAHAIYQVSRTSPTGDERHNKRKSGHFSRQPQSESARRPVGTFSSASDVTDHRIETASLKARARRAGAGSPVLVKAQPRGIGQTWRALSEGPRRGRCELGG